MFKKLAEQLKANARTIVFTEGTDARILEAADKLTTEGILGVILLGKADEVKSAAKEAGFNIEKCQIIDPEQYAEIPFQIKLLWNNVSKDGQGRLSVRWSNILYSRYCTSCITVN